MISIPIWLLVLFCVFGFIGLCCVLLLIYGIVASILTPCYIYEEGEIQDENDTTSN